MRSPRPSLPILIGIALLMALAVARSGQVRDRALAGLGEGMPPREAALARGFVLGEDGGLDQRTKEDFIRAGLSHLTAVSGENVTLLALLAMPVLAAFGIPLRERLLWVIGLVALYVPLAGSGPSIQRAGIMGAAGLLATLKGRRRSRLHALGLALVATLAIDPGVAGDVGWQLSFAAVLGILVLAAPIRGRLLARLGPGAWRRTLAEGIAVTVAATLATAPLIAFVFEEISLTSLAANVLVLPAVAPAMWLGMVAAALAQVPGIPLAPLNGLDALLLAYIAQVAAWCARPSWAVLHIHIGLLAMLATYAATAAVLVLGAGLSRTRRLSRARRVSAARRLSAAWPFSRARRPSPAPRLSRAPRFSRSRRIPRVRPVSFARRLFRIRRVPSAPRPTASRGAPAQPSIATGRNAATAPAVDPRNIPAPAVDPSYPWVDEGRPRPRRVDEGRPRSGAVDEGRPRPGRVDEGRPRRGVGLAGGALIALGLAGVGAYVVLTLRLPGPGVPPGPVPGLRIEVLDVGQGDAILLQPRRAPAVLVDGGPPGDELVAKLRDEGVSRLGAAIVTHDQSDHAAGIAAAVGRLPIARLLYGRLDGRLLATARADGTRLERVAAGTTIRSGRLRLEVIWPPPVLLADDPPNTDPNALALVIRARWRRFAMLLTADAEAESTPLDPGPVDVLKVAHHGSDDAGLGALLDRIRPRLAVISVGTDNPYGHPTAGTLATLAVHGVKTLRTDLDGTIEIDVTRRSFSVHSS